MIKSLLKRNKNIKEKKGITLIALIITVIIMVILAGVVINTITDDSGLFSNVKKSSDLYTQSTITEEEKIGDLINIMDNYIISEEGFNYDFKVNVPKLKEGMIPITYDNTKGWVVADKNNENKEWYDYENKKWANICTVDSDHASYRTVSVGTIIPVEEMTTMFVWIPRYAYSIVNGYQTSNEDSPSITNNREEKNIEIKFLVGNTNKDSEENNYNINYNEKTEVKNGKTPMIVHPGFRFGASELTGIWIGKFEASGLDNNGRAVGNANATSVLEQYAPDSTTYIRVLPNVISWRHINIGECQYQSMKMSNNTDAYGWNNVNTHLIKNNEWGAAAYLCYSKYGNVPMTNGAGQYNREEVYFYDIYTGAGPKNGSNETRYEDYSLENHGYNTDNGFLSSTTNNIYGIYDMAGGSWDKVAVYFNNKNDNLKIFGNPISNNSIKYFDENNKLKEEYKNYWDVYEVSEEERSNLISVEGESQHITQNELWEKYNSDLYMDAEVNKRYNKARKRLADKAFELLFNYKGIGINEISNVEIEGEKIAYSYYGVNTEGKYVWLANYNDTTRNIIRSWNGDYALVGTSNRPFMARGGVFYDGIGAGVFAYIPTERLEVYDDGFRVAMCF